jgi:hypothetical protein
LLLKYDRLMADARNGRGELGLMVEERGIREKAGSIRVVLRREICEGGPVGPGSSRGCELMSAAGVKHVPLLDVKGQHARIREALQAMIHRIDSQKFILGEQTLKLEQESAASTPH